MKNTIEYYYNIEVYKIHQNKKNYYFEYQNNNYIFVPFQFIESIEILYNLSQFLYRSLLSHQIILTKDNNKFLNVNNEPYILLKLCCNKASITYDEIFKLNSITFNKENNILRRDDWGTLWSEKVDYFEYQLNQSGKKYPLIRQSMAYYIGISENAISLFNMTKKDKLNICLSHKRIKYNTTTVDLYNPLNFVIDYRVRDICEYFKDSFFEGVDIYPDIEKYLFYNNLTYEESCLFFSRLLFPTYYFDLYEEILLEKIDEKQINKILSKTIEYENVLKKVYYFLRQNNKLPLIEWLN